MDKISGDGCVSPPGAAQSLMAQYLGDLPNRRTRPGTLPRNVNVHAQSDPQHLLVLHADTICSPIPTLNAAKSV